MAKNKKSPALQKQTSNAHIALVVGFVLLLVLRLNINDGKGTIFGYKLAEDYGSGLISIVATLSMLGMISLFFNRKNMTMWALGRLALIYIAAFLFVFGWKLAATGSGTMNIQNDGYSVTGAFMMFFSGLYFGYLATVGRMNNGKK